MEGGGERGQRSLVSSVLEERAQTIGCFPGLRYALSPGFEANYAGICEKLGAPGGRLSLEQNPRAIAQSFTSVSSLRPELPRQHTLS